MVIFFRQHQERYRTWRLIQLLQMKKADSNYYALNILDTPIRRVFDRITRLVARILDVPHCIGSLVDTERQWFKSRIGIDTNETREVAFVLMP